MDGTAVTDDALEALAALPELAVLELRRTKATAAGVGKLAKALPGCRILYPGGVLEPTDASRAAAEWVLSAGGEVTIRDGAAPRPIRAAKELPAGPLVVVQVHLSGTERR